MRWHLGAFLVGVCVPMLALGQPLADRVPKDAIVYVGWRGTDQMPEGYEKTHLKALLDESNLRQVFNDMVPRLIQRVAREDKDAAAIIQTVVAIGGPLWRHPTAIYFTGLDWEAGPEPMPRAGLMCLAGKDAEGLAAQINGMLSKIVGGEIPAGFPLKVVQQGELVLMTFNMAEGTAAEAGQSLGAGERFKQGIAQVQKDPMAVFYVDVEGVMGLVNEGFKRNTGEQEQAIWGKVRDSFGLSGIKQFVWTAGFDGADFGVQAFLGAPGPRVGLLKMLDQEPLSEELLKNIPAGATCAVAWTMDMDKLLAEVRAALGNVDPEVQKMFDMGMGVAQMALAMNVQKDLFEPLGDQWAAYLDPQTGGSGPLGIVAVNRFSKPAEANRALNKLELFVDNTSNGLLRGQNMRITFDQVKVGDLSIHYAQTPLVSPSWAVKGDTLYAGLYPQVVAAAAGRAATEKSILNSEGFQSARQRLGGQKASGFVYLDLPATAHQGYQAVLALTQAGMGIADMFGVKAPPMVIPPLAKIKQHLSPAAAFWWTDEAGWHLRGSSPFPGSELLAVQGDTAIMGAVAMSFVGLRASHAGFAVGRGNANRAKSMSNLRQIGQGLMMYANDNKGKYPENLGALLAYVQQVDAFISPAGPKQVPAKIRTAGREEQAKWINENADYVYVGATARPMDGPERVLAYEKAEYYHGQSTHVLFNDGHVEWMPYGRLMQKIQGGQ